MAGSTSHYGLSRLNSGDSLSDSGYKYPDADRELIDRILYQGAEDHRHTGEVGSVEEPTDAPTLSLETTGGVIPSGTRVYYKYTYVSPSGGETIASTEGFIDTPDALVSPSAPVITSTTTGGALGGGNYYYVLTAYVGSSTNESRAQHPAFTTLSSTATTQVVTLTLPDPESGQTGFNVYRRKPGQSRYYHLATVPTDVATPPTTYEDDGSVLEDCDRGIPTVNSTNSTNTITVSMPGATPVVPEGYTWRLYRTYVSGSWANSFLASVVEGVTEFSTFTTPEYVDVGTSTLPGTYPAVSLILGSPPKVDLTGGAEVQGELPVEMISGGAVQTIVAGSNVTVDDSDPYNPIVHATGGGGGAGMATITIAASDSSVDDIANAAYTCDGTNDEVQIQAAYDDLTDSLGGTIVLAPGTYNIGATITLGTAPVWIRGSETSYPQTPSTMLIRNVAANYPMITVTSASYLAYGWEDLFMYDDASFANTSPMISVGQSCALTFARVNMENDQATGGVGLSLGATNCTVNVEDSQIQGEGNAIYATGQIVHLRARHSYFNSWSAESINLLSLAAGSDIDILDCVSDGAGTVGYRIDGVSNDCIVRIEGGECYTDNTEDIYVSDVTWLSVKNVRLGGNSSTDTALRINNVDRGEISGVRIAGAGQHGIWILDSDEIDVHDNHIYDVGQTTDNTYSGILLDGDTNNCRVHDNQVHTDGAGNLPLYGIRIDDSTCDNNWVSNNDLRTACKTNGNEISDAGTGTRGHDVIAVAVTDEVTTLTTGAAKTTFRMPFTMVLTAVRASLTTVSSSGAPAFDINDTGVSVFSTTLTIDASEKTSTTAATAAVISDKYLLDDAEITVDIDTAGTGAVGAKISLYGWRI